MALPTQLTTNHIELFGTPDMILEDPGVLREDREYLLTCTAIIKFPAPKWLQYILDPAIIIGAQHPIFKANIPGLVIESREIAFRGPWATVSCNYAGISNQYSFTEGTPPQYELIVNVGESPLTTHPDFVDDIGGSAAAPLNGAVFSNVDSTKPVAREGQIAKDPGGYHFDSFDIVKKGETTMNDFAGISGFLEAGATWRKSWKMYRLPNTGDMSSVGRIQFPPGNPPTPSGRNWLNMGINCSHNRGGAFMWSEEWRLSGRRGWETKIYRIAG